MPFLLILPRKDDFIVFLSLSIFMIWNELYTLHGSFKYKRFSWLRSFEQEITIQHVPKSLCLVLWFSQAENSRKLSLEPLVYNSLLLQVLIIEVTSNNQIMYGKLERSNSIQKVQKDWTVGNNFKSPFGQNKPTFLFVKNLSFCLARHSLCAVCSDPQGSPSTNRSINWGKMVPNVQKIYDINYFN